MAIAQHAPTRITDPRTVEIESSPLDANVDRWTKVAQSLAVRAPNPVSDGWSWVFDEGIAVIAMPGR